jgi:prepilin-type N-terminal cleavage/methylation domain-containing protein
MILTKINKKGFTLIELLVVVAIIGVLAVLIVSSLAAARNKAYSARTLQEFRSFQQAMELYLNDNGNYPADVSRNIPAGVEAYLGGGSWPDGPYPGSVYDWDNITQHDYIQISLRFCDVNGDNCRFPSEAWAQDFDSYSAMYWCFKGECRSHPNRPINHPGFCVNCRD